MTGRAVPHRGKTAPVHHRAERHHVLPFLVAAHPVLCQHHRPEDHLRLGLRHRRCGRRAVARHAVARHELLDDPPLRPHKGRDLQPHPDHARQAVLHAGTGRAPVRGYNSFMQPVSCANLKPAVTFYAFLGPIGAEIPRIPLCSPENRRIRRVNHAI